MITEDQHWTAKVIKGNRGGSKDFEKRGGGGGGTLCWQPNGQGRKI